MLKSYKIYTHFWKKLFNVTWSSFHSIIIFVFQTKSFGLQRQTVHMMRGLWQFCVKQKHQRIESSTADVIKACFTCSRWNPGDSYKMLNKWMMKWQHSYIFTKSFHSTWKSYRIWLELAIRCTIMRHPTILQNTCSNYMIRSLKNLMRSLKKYLMYENLPGFKINSCMPKLSLETK